VTGNIRDDGLVNSQHVYFFLDFVHEVSNSTMAS
jgi:hypothetical protein